MNEITPQLSQVFAEARGASAPQLKMAITMIKCVRGELLAQLESLRALRQSPAMIAWMEFEAANYSAVIAVLASIETIARDETQAEAAPQEASHG